MSFEFPTAIRKRLPMGDVEASGCSKVLNIVVEVIQDHGLRIEKINIIIGKCGRGRAVVPSGCEFF